MTIRPDELFLLGLVTGTHGLHGDLKIRPLSENSDVLLSAGEIFLRRGDGLVRYLPARVSIHKGNFLLRLQDLTSIDAVQPLVGCEVLMYFGDLAPPGEDEFYWFQLEGMTVVDRNRGEIGTLEDLFTTAAHDIYVVRGCFGEVLIPAVDEFIIEIDEQGGRLLVDLPEGLVPDDL